MILESLLFDIVNEAERKGGRVALAMHRALLRHGCARQSLVAIARLKRVNYSGCIVQLEPH